MMTFLRQTHWFHSPPHNATIHLCCCLLLCDTVVMFSSPSPVSFLSYHLLKLEGNRKFTYVICWQLKYFLFLNGGKNSSQDPALGVLRHSWLVNGDRKTGIYHIRCSLLGVIYGFSVNAHGSSITMNSVLSL